MDLVCKKITKFGSCENEKDIMVYMEWLVMSCEPPLACVTGVHQVRNATQYRYMCLN